MELKIQNLSKRYPNGVQALKHITLTIPRGLFGLLGPNGAGKSTLMRTIATLQDPDEGAIHFADASTLRQAQGEGGSGQAPSTLRQAQGEAGSGQAIDVIRQKDRVREMLGYLPQEFGVYPHVTAERLLDHFARLKGLTGRRARQEIVHALLQQTNLYDVRKKKLGGYSGGMRQRFGVAVALLGNPKLIIVDEPTAGLDPAERVRFLNLLSELGEDAVVILSTHIVDDVAELCSRLAIIDKGQVLLETQPAQAVAAMRGRIWRRVIEKREVSALAETHPIISTKLLAGRTVVRVHSATPVSGFEPAEPDLEDVYFSALAGHYAGAHEPIGATR
jgi:ABC-type multidrug transport system ATPase subunit